MDETSPVTQPPASGLRLALVVLVVALIAALAYIIHLRDRVAQLERRPPTAVSQVAPPAAPRPQAPAAAPQAQAPAAAAPVTVSEDAIAAALTAEQRRQILATLKAQTGPDRRASFHVHQSNPDTTAVQTALQRLFEEAGWPTDTVRTPYPLKSGIFILAADETPPPYVDAVNDAFSAAGIDVQYLTGYRAFIAERKQSNPNWRGPDLAANQAFTLVVGSKPTPKAAAPSDGFGSSEM